MSEDVGKNEERTNVAKLLGGRICCLVGLLLGAGGILFALLGASANVSAGAVGAALGVLGYFLGARRLGAATIVLGVIAKGHCKLPPASARGRGDGSPLRLSPTGYASKALLCALDALDLGVAEHQPVAALTHSGVDSPVLAVGRAE
jgi:hypothetical protein